MMRGTTNHGPLLDQLLVQRRGGDADRPSTSGVIDGVRCMIVRVLCICIAAVIVVAVVVGIIGLRVVSSLRLLVGLFYWLFLLLLLLLLPLRRRSRPSAFGEFSAGFRWRPLAVAGFWCRQPLLSPGHTRHSSASSSSTHPTTMTS